MTALRRSKTKTRHTKISDNMVILKSGKLRNSKHHVESPNKIGK